MTNHDRSELVKLFPLSYEDGPDYCTVKDATGKDFALTVRPQIMKEMESALRRLASSDGGVKVRELEWSVSNVATSLLGKYMIDGWRSGKFSIVRPGRHDDGTRYSSLDAAKAAAQADYEVRIRSALVEVPADAGMREALEDAEGIFEQIRLALIKHLDEPVRSAFWKAVEGREKCRAALTAPGATTKSDGGVEGHAIPRTTSATTTRYPETEGEENMVATARRTEEQSSTKTGQAGIKPGPSDPSSTRSEVTDDIIKRLQQLGEKHGCLPGEDRIAWLDHELTVLTTLKPPDIGKTYTIEHDGFIGKVIGGYYTIEGKEGVVLQQVGTRVVHVYGRKWLKKVD